MSDEKVQSILSEDSTLECNYENFWAESLSSPDEEVVVRNIEEEAVCEARPEDYYNKDGICEQEVISRREYVETEKGIVAIIRVDEEKALERRAQRFQETEESAPAQEQRSEESAEAQVHQLPHSHGEEAMAAGSAAPISETHPQEAVPLPAIINGSYLCYCLGSDYPAQETPGARGMHLEGREAVRASEAELQSRSHSIPDSAISFLGAAILISDCGFFESIPEVYSQEGFGQGDFSLLSRAIHYTIRQTNERQAALPADVETALSGDGSLPLHYYEGVVVTVHEHSSHRFVSPEGVSFGPDTSLPKQGAIVFAEGMPDLVPVFVFYPGVFPKDSQTGNGYGTSAASGARNSYARVKPGSNPQGGGERHPGSHSGGRQSGGRQHHA